MRHLIILILISLCEISLGQIDIRLDDKLRISEAIKISNIYGNGIWSDFDKTPFSILLIDDEFEYLINHSNPSKDFNFIKYDTILNSNTYYRKRKFNKRLLATFPAVNGVSCIVIGTPENTGKSSSEWIITLLHEHFHQYTNTSLDYHKDVNGLNLSNGDTTGMWMLNYPFPYKEVNVINAYKEYAIALKELVLKINNGKTDFKNKYKLYLKKRGKFQKILTEDDYKYFSFQLWQEGIARYTEIKFLEMMKDYKASPEITKLIDYIPFNELKKTLLSGEINNITTKQLDEEERVCFYSIGLAEGIVLDEINPNWREKYLKEKFFLEKY